MMTVDVDRFEVLPVDSEIVVTESFWEWKHGKIRLWETDPHPDGPAVILVHGFAATLEHWRRNIPDLARTATVYSMDLLGFGQSAMPELRYSVKLWGEQIQDFMTERGIDQAVLVGHSMGGSIAAQFAHDFPEKVSGLVLVDSSGLPARNVTAGIHRVLALAADSQLVRDAAYFLFANRETIRQGLETAYYRTSAISADLIETFAAPLANRNAMHGYLAVAHAPDDFSIVAPNGIAAPTLIFWGEHDRLLSPKLVKHFTDLIPSAQVILVPECGHCPHDETPEIFNPAVVDFLRTSGALTPAARSRDSTESPD